MQWLIWDIVRYFVPPLSGSLDTGLDLGLWCQLWGGLHTKITYFCDELFNLILITVNAQEELLIFRGLIFGF